MNTTTKIENETPRQNLNPAWPQPEFDTDPSTFRPGSVRLLSPYHYDQKADPNVDHVCVLVVKPWVEGWDLIIPFSAVATDPQTEWELRTQHDQPRLEVLQVWNARSVPRKVLEEGWHLIDVSPEIVEDALILFQAKMNGGEVPNRLKRRVGPLYGSFGYLGGQDRIDYQRKQMAVFNPLMRLSVSYMEAGPE
jgi:hypothetical protein